MAISAGVGWYFVGVTGATFSVTGATFSLLSFFCYNPCCCPCALGIVNPAALMMDSGKLLSFTISSLILHFFITPHCPQRCFPSIVREV
jgi:hypothetical protein